MAKAEKKQNEPGTSLVPESKECSKNVEERPKDTRARLKGPPWVDSGTI